MIAFFVFIGLVAGLIVAAYQIGWVAAVLATSWFLVAVGTARAISIAGEKNSRTVGDSFSGDDELDFCLVMLWPIFVPAWMVWSAIGHVAARGEPHLAPEPGEVEREI